MECYKLKECEMQEGPSDLPLKQVMRPSWERYALYTQRKRAFLVLFWMVYVPPPHIPVLKLYPCRRWGLGEIIRIRWHHEGGVLMRGISGLRRVMRELAASLLCHVRRPEAGGLQPKRGPSPCWHLISEFWPPGLWEMDWCLEAIPALVFLYGSWS